MTASGQMSLVCGQLGQRPQTSWGTGRGMRLGERDEKIIRLPTHLLGERSRFDTDLRGFREIARVVLRCRTQTQPAGKAAGQALIPPQWNKQTDKERESKRKE